MMQHALDDRHVEAGVVVRDAVSVEDAKFDGALASLAVRDLDRVRRGVDAGEPRRMRLVPEAEGGEAVAAADVDDRPALETPDGEDELQVARQDMPAGELRGGRI